MNYGIRKRAKNSQKHISNAKCKIEPKQAKADWDEQHSKTLSANVESP